LIATNGYTTPLVKAVRQEIFPAGSYIIVTQPCPLNFSGASAPVGECFLTANTSLTIFA
jgi:hypothetical protein